MLPSEELLQSIDIIAQNAAKNGVKIYTAIVTAVGDNNTCSVRVNGKTHSNIAYYGDAPTVNKSYRVFCPNGSMNQAFIITGFNLPSYTKADAGKVLSIDCNNSSLGNTKSPLLYHHGSHIFLYSYHDIMLTTSCHILLCQFSKPAYERLSIAHVG